MNWFGSAPRRWRLVVGLAAYLIGTVFGGLYESVVPLWAAYLGLAFLGVFCLVRHYLTGICFLLLGAFLVGSVWANSHAAGLTLGQSARYTGPVEVAGVRLIESSQSRIQLKLLESSHRGQLIEGYEYDWVLPVGTRLNITADISPNTYRSALGRNVLGKINHLGVGEVVAAPRGYHQFRQRIIDRVGSSLPEPHASLAVGLVTGVNSDFDDSFRDDLRRTGTTHIVAVSGSNLTILSLLVMRLVRRFGRWWAFGAASVVLISYASLAGFNPSVSRGLVMAGLALLAATLGRPTHRLPLILMAAAILSIPFPLGPIYSVSWQLSFLAFTGIVFLGQPIGHFFERFGAFGAMVAETLAAEIAVLPLVLATFGELSVVAPLVNGIVLLFVPLAMTVSFVHTLVSLISIAAGRLAAWFTYPILTLITRPIEWASKLPFASFTIGDRPLWLIVAMYLGVIMASVWLIRRTRNELDA